MVALLIEELGRSFTTLVTRSYMTFLSMLTRREFAFEIPTSWDDIIEFEGMHTLL